MQIRNLFFILTLSMGGLLSAQDPADIFNFEDLFVIAKYTDSGTELRWGYPNTDVWFTNFRQPVIIYRRAVERGNGGYTEIARVSLMPEAELETYASQHGGMTGVILSMAYQDWENSTYDPDSGDDFMEAHDNLINRYTLFHYASDRDSKAAKAAGLYFKDTETEPGVVYSYRIVTSGEQLAHGFRVVPPKVVDLQPLLHRARNEPNAVELSWDREIHDKMFSGYFIERSQGNNGRYERLNDVPYVQGYDGANREAARYYTYMDSIAVGQELRYRLVGIDPFGEESKPSPPVVVRGEDLTPPPAPALQADQLEQLHLQKTLTWFQPPGEEVVSYHLQRRFDNKKEVVIDFAKPGDTIKIDQLDVDGPYEYNLIAQDAAGNLAWSNTVLTRVLDREPPSQPTGLTAEADTNGLVTLIWDPPIEKDVRGYYVYARDGKDRAFRRLTNMPHQSRRYVDTISMELMNQYRYYYVTAIDKDILYSRGSDTLEIKRPDKYPPAPALIADFKVTKGDIRLNFRPSNSRDVTSHTLRRKLKGATAYTDLVTWEQPPFFYHDTTAVPGQTYLYTYHATDATGLTSKIVSEVQVTAKRPDLEAPTLAAENRDFRVVLSWPDMEDADAWQLYRSVNDGPEMRLITLGGEKKTFADARTKSEKTYRYRLRLIRADGRRSPFSEPVEISL